MKVGDMEQRPQQPPEGRLIEQAAQRRSLSVREAARRAGLSYGRWRQIVKGYQNVSPGEYAAVHAPARTVARMAAVAGVTPEALAGEGQRPDAAGILRELHAQQQEKPPPALAAAPEDAEPDDEASVMFPHDRVARHIWRKNRPEEERLRELAEWRGVQARYEINEAYEWIFMSDLPMERRLGMIQTVEEGVRGANADSRGVGS